VRGRHLLTTITLGTCLLAAPILMANVTPVNYPTPTPPGFSIYGVITNIDPVNRMIQVRQSSGMIETIHITEAIQVLRNGEPATFNTLTLGDTVAVTAR
jgi:hypothetical protein